MKSCGKLNSSGNSSDEKCIKVYIVEDYPLFRMDMVCALQKRFKVLGYFETAEECIDAMKETPADVVIMDLGLRKMNGIEATTKIKQYYPDTKVIAYTSYEEKSVAMAAIASGVSGYFSKETEFDSLANFIEIIHKGAMYLDPRIADIAYDFFPKPFTTDMKKLYPPLDTNMSLTERELEILIELARGKNNPEIASEFFISKNTVKAHVTHIFKKLDVTNRMQAADKARRFGLISEDSIN